MSWWSSTPQGKPAADKTTPRTGSSKDVLAAGAAAVAPVAGAQRKQQGGFFGLNPDAVTGEGAHSGVMKTHRHTGRKRRSNCL
jgi:hypothetical protein